MKDENEILKSENNRFTVTQSQGAESQQATPKKTSQNQTNTNNSRSNEKQTTLFMCDSNGKYLRLNKLCRKHNVTYSIDMNDLTRKHTARL